MGKLNRESAEQEPPRTAGPGAGWARSREGAAGRGGAPRPGARTSAVLATLRGSRTSPHSDTCVAPMPLPALCRRGRAARGAQPSPGCWERT